MDKEQINLRIIQIIDDCKSVECEKRLNDIKRSLNDEDALQVTGRFAKIKHFFRRVNSKYRKDFEKTKVEKAEKDILETIRKDIVSSEEIMQGKIFKSEPSEFGQVVNNLLNLELGLEFGENSVKRYNIELTDSVKQEEYSRLLDRNCI